MRFATFVSATAVLIGAAAPVAATFDFHHGCSIGKFYWDDKNICLPKLGDLWLGPSPPQGVKCPKLWYYHQDLKCCAPRLKPILSKPICPGGTDWSTGTFTCKSTVTPGSSCKGNEWWWSGLSCCLPHGGPPSPPLPPPGKDCPNVWYWNGGQGCCTPKHPPQNPVPNCRPGWQWSPGIKCCKPVTTTPPSPQPSSKPGSAYKKRQPAVPHHKKKVAKRAEQLAFCETGYASCPINGIFSKEVECIDTLSELTSCGGCTSIGKGQDCSRIPKIKVSSCSGGSCVVLSCKAGYTVSKDRSSCVAA